MTSENSFKGKITSKVTTWALNNLNLIFSILRLVKPNIVVKGNAVITRFEDVTEVLDRNWVFQAPYTEKMEKITNGGNFFLGMQSTVQHTRDVSNMRLAVRRNDINEIVIPFVTQACLDILSASDGKVDVVRELTRVVPARLLGKYFGTPGWDETEFTDAAAHMFQYLFYPDDPEVEKNALASAEKTRNYLDKTIAARKLNRGQHDDILERCLILQDSGTPEMTDLDIRNNFIGLIIGAIPMASKSAAITLNHLFNNPQLLTKAQQAARADNDEEMVKYMQESLRLNPFAIGVKRICAEDCVVAKGTLRSSKIPKGTIVLAATKSAMMDARKIIHPKEFHLDRQDYIYMHFGYGLHTCFGQYVNLSQIPAIVKAVLKKQGLRRVSTMEIVDTFPVSLKIEFDN